MRLIPAFAEEAPAAGATSGLARLDEHESHPKAIARCQIDRLRHVSAVYSTTIDRHQQAARDGVNDRTPFRALLLSHAEAALSREASSQEMTKSRIVVAAFFSNQTSIQALRTCCLGAAEKSPKHEVARCGVPRV